jgi:hypothetical protein
MNEVKLNSGCKLNAGHPAQSQLLTNSRAIILIELARKAHQLGAFTTA